MRRVTTSDFEQGDWVEYSADGIRLINDIRRITRPDNDSVWRRLGVRIFFNFFKNIACDIKIKSYFCIVNDKIDKLIEGLKQTNK